MRTIRKRLLSISSLSNSFKIGFEEINFIKNVYRKSRFSKGLEMNSPTLFYSINWAP